MSSDTAAPAGNVPRLSLTRERILDAFAHLLIDQGERAATLDAVAAAAALSKGGLLYHFGSKDALVEGLLARLDALVADDVEQIRAAPAGAVDYLIRTSMSEGTALDQSIGAAVRLAQGAHPLANMALASTRRQWLSVIEEAVGDPDVAEVIMLVSDGLYYESTLASPGQPAVDDTSTTRLDRLLAVIGRVTERPVTG